MKVKNLQDFKSLIKNANHRERFVFDIPKNKPFYHDTECCSFEVYVTHKSGPIDNPVIRSVSYQTVSIEGKFNKDWNQKRSCQLHITSDAEWDMFYNIISK